MVKMMQPPDDKNPIVKRLLMVWVVCNLPACSLDTNETASAYAVEITSPTQLIGGPKATGDLGDYLLGNGIIRVIVQSGERYGSAMIGRGNTVFAGSIIDADRIDHGRRSWRRGGFGNDHFNEILPIYFMQTSGAYIVDVVNSGESGGAAVVRVRGRPAELVSMLSALDFAMLLPLNLEYETEYRIEPGNDYVEISSCMINTHDSYNQRLPPFDPLFRSAQGDKTIDLPDRFPIPMGDFLLFSETTHMFIPGDAGFDPRYASEQELKTDKQLPQLHGLTTDLLVSAGGGISYGFMMKPSANSYLSQRDHAGRLIYGETRTDQMLVPFIWGANTALMEASPPELLGPHEKSCWTRYFIIGNGDVADVRTTAHQIRGDVTGRFAGRLLDQATTEAVAGASVVVLKAGKPYSQFMTDKRGRFEGQMLPGAYAYVIVRDGVSPFPSREQPIFMQIEENQTTWVENVVPSPGLLNVSVVDLDTGSRVPAKISVVGVYDPAYANQDPRTFLFDKSLGEEERYTDQIPDTADPRTREYLEKSFAIIGNGMEKVRPGIYRIVASRGFEFDTSSIDNVMISPGVTTTIALGLRRGIDTRGYISADLHVHGIESPDSSIDYPERALSFAAEGIEFIAATDHNFVTDYQPAISQAGLAPYVHSVGGLEITTWEGGHFNGYPLRVQPGKTTNGSFRWYERKVGELFDELRNLGVYGPDHTIVQVNHPRSPIEGYFHQFNVDPITAEPADADSLAAPLGEIYKPASFSWKFDSIEIAWSVWEQFLETFRVPPASQLPDDLPLCWETNPQREGELLRLYKSDCSLGKIAFPGVIEEWFSLLNHGKVFTAVGDSDSHVLIAGEVGAPRNFLKVPNDDPDSIDDLDLVDAIKQHRGIVSNGPFINLFVNGHEIGDSICVPGGEVDVEVRFQTANWVSIDELKLIVNGEMLPQGRWTDVSGVSQQGIRRVSIPLDRDAWVVAMARGKSLPLWPVLAPNQLPIILLSDTVRPIVESLLELDIRPIGGLKPVEVAPRYPYAITNPIWVDVGDGNGRCNGFTPTLLPPSSLLH